MAGCRWFGRERLPTAVRRYERGRLYSSLIIAADSWRGVELPLSVSSAAVGFSRLADIMGCHSDPESGGNVWNPESVFPDALMRPKEAATPPLKEFGCILSDILGCGSRGSTPPLTGKVLRGKKKRLPTSNAPYLNPSLSTLSTPLHPCKKKKVEYPPRPVLSSHDLSL